MLQPRYLLPGGNGCHGPGGRSASLPLEPARGGDVGLPTPRGGLVYWWINGLVKNGGRGLGSSGQGAAGSEQPAERRERTSGHWPTLQDPDRPRSGCVRRVHRAPRECQFAVMFEAQYP